MEIMAGLHLIEVPNPSSARTPINSYLIQGDQGWTMVDTGWDTPEALAAIESQLGEIGLGFRDIVQVIITHFHPDHYGLASKIKQFSKTKLAMHQMEKALIDPENTNLNDLSAEIAQWLHTNGVPIAEIPHIGGVSPAMRAFVSFPSPEITLYGGEIISTGIFNLEVIWTPGHSPGHVCLYEAERKILLTGDHILPNITPNIGLHPMLEGNPLKDYLTSLENLEQLEADLILPAHQQIFTDLQKRIEELLQHHKHRGNAILKSIEFEPKTTYLIASEIPWTADGDEVDFQDLTFVDKRLAIWETLAHLTFLVAAGSAEKGSKEDVVYYSTS